MRKLFLFLLLSIMAYAAGATCTAGFNWTPAQTTTNPLKVQFTSTATWSGSPSLFGYIYYTFGDGTSGYGPIVSHNYSAPGTYNVTEVLYVDDSLTNTLYCSDSITHQVTISYLPCAGNYTYNITGNSTVNFTAQSYPGTPGVVFNWHFGDGTSGTGSPVSHTYATNGNYLAKLIISVPGGCTDTIYKTITISNVPSPCAGHTAGFTDAISGSNVYFYSTSASFGGQTKTYYWWFGDGTTGTGPYPTHNYSVTGNYPVVMAVSWTDSVTGAVICSDTVQHSITVNTGNCAGHTSSFTDYINSNTTYFYSSVPYFPGQNVALTWSFGDGMFGSGANPVHNYVYAGTYSVRLISVWTDSLNGGYVCRDTTWGTVVIAQSGNCLNHHAVFTDYVNNSTVYFYNSSASFAGQTAQYYWWFGDGTTSNAASPVHIYSAAGTYSVRLTVYWVDTMNTLICMDSVSHTVTTTAAPNLIQGIVYVDSTSNFTGPDTFKVWLIVHDSTNGTLTAIDSTTVSGIWSTYYSFSNKPAGTYLVKAAMLNQSPGSNGYVPTYHDSSLYWNQAINFYHSGGTFGTFYNIYMRHGIVTSGPGFVGGNISMGANKGTSNGIEGILVYLENQNGKLIASDYTDINGDYSFSNIPLGTYTIYPEAMNYITTPINSIQLTAGNTSSTGNNFGQNNTEIKPKSTGIITLPSDSYVAYPNPATSKVYIHWASAPSEAFISITDVAGHKVYEATVKNASAVTDINVAQLQSGMYFMHIKTAAGDHTDKLVIQH